MEDDGEIDRDSIRRQSYEDLIVKKYYNKLFKEYVIADFSRYKSGDIGLRWRTKQEVLSGKGKFICGNKICKASRRLNTYEINFSYQEKNQQKNALVKVRVCEECAALLNYKKMHKALKADNDLNECAERQDTPDDQLKKKVKLEGEK